MNRTLKVLSADKGGEFMSADFKKYLKKQGVQHELTVPKAPKQNGSAERINQTLVLGCLPAEPQSTEGS